MTNEGQPGSGQAIDLHLEAPLHVVAASDYLRYGAGRRQTMDGDPDLLAVCLSLIGAGGASLYALDGLRLVKAETGPNQIVWAGFFMDEGIQIGWVWDFFRMLSHVILRWRAAEAGPEPGGLKRALRGLHLGDSLDLRVDAAGGFVQPHPITETFLAGWATHRAG
jgi:hypothetical protein